ncbi:MAG: dienelactone hydrolase family protein [Planctomycetota bacterium]|nr:dienelactone hydrolase family protein [Planctomycetota bacterium]
MAKSLSSRSTTSKSDGHSKGRAALYALLGDLPPRHRPIGSKLVSSTEEHGYVLERLTLDLNGIEPVSAYFVRPAGASGPLPCVLYNHSHGGKYGIGKDELIRERDGVQSPTYAIDLTRRGYCALCIDTWAFGERRGRSEGEIFKLMLWQGQIMWGMMVYDSLRAIDYLTTRPDVDAKRIGTMGLSMGSTMAWWTAALDPRVKACVDLLCLTDYQALIKAQGLNGHGYYYFVPGLLKHFTAAQINAMIAPRPHLSIAGIYDGLTPAEGLERIDRELRKTYGSMQASKAWRLMALPIAHYETAEARAATLAWFDQWL